MSIKFFPTNHILLLFFLILITPVNAVEYVNNTYSDFYRTPYFFTDLNGTYEKSSSNIENCETYSTYNQYFMPGDYDVTQIDEVVFKINSVNNSNNSLYFSFYDADYRVSSLYKQVLLNSSYIQQTFPSGVYYITLPINVQSKRTFFTMCVRENFDTPGSEIQFGFGGYYVDRIPHSWVVQSKIIERDDQFADDIYSYNDISFAINGYKYNVANAIPVATATQYSNVSNYTSNYSNNYTGGVNTTGWGNYSSQIIGQINGTIYTIFQIIDYPFSGLRNGIQSINSSLNNSTYNLSMSFLVVVVPPIINSIPNKIKLIITLYLVFLIILIILGKS